MQAAATAFRIKAASRSSREGMIASAREINFFHVPYGIVETGDRFEFDFSTEIAFGSSASTAAPMDVQPLPIKIDSLIELIFWRGEISRSS